MAIKKIAKFSCMSGLNAGDVIISEAISRILENNYVIENFDIQDSVFSATNRLNASRKYHVPNDYWLRNTLASQVRILQYYLKWHSLVVKRVKDADIVIIGGGQIIDDYGSGHMFFRIFNLAKLCEKYQKKLFISCVGVSKINAHNYSKLRKIMLISTDFTVRDEASRKRLIDVDPLFEDVKVAPDPVFLAPYLVNFTKKPTRYLGVNVMNLNRVLKKEIQDCKTLAENLSTLARKLELDIKIILTAYGDDLNVANELIQRLRKLDLEPNISPIHGLEDAASVFSDVDFMLSNRMHSAILSLSFGIPTMIYDWHPKITALFVEVFGKSADNFLLKSPNVEWTEVSTKYVELKKMDIEKLLAPTQSISVGYFNRVFNL